MAFKPLKILAGGLKLATSIIPGGGLVKGLLGLAAKKIPGAEKVLNDLFNEAESIFIERSEIRDAYLKEQEAERKFLIESEGRYSELSKVERVWRTLCRPMLTVFVVGTFLLSVWINLASQLFKFNPVVIPVEILSFSKVIIAFWFVSRGAEKIMTIVKGNNKDI